MSQHNTAIPRASAAYRAARESAARVARAGRGRLVVSGKDRASYLQGLLTNDIAALLPGGGCYAAYLTPQGRMITDLHVYELGDVILLAVPIAVKDALLARLDQFVFTEDVQLGDATASFATTAVVGPSAAAIVANLTGVDAGAVRSLPLHGNLRAAFDGGSAIVVRIDDTGEPGFDVYVEQAHAPALGAALDAAGVPLLDEASAEAIRIEAGVPLFGRDMDETTIPLEAGIESRAISFTKGCYVGQEVIIRVLHRGHGRVARKLVGLEIDGAIVPPHGAPIAVGGKDAGAVTSAAWSPALGKPIALGYVQRDYANAGTEAGIQGTRASVVAVPFIRGS